MGNKISPYHTLVYDIFFPTQPPNCPLFLNICPPSHTHQTASDAKTPHTPTRQSTMVKPLPHRTDSRVNMSCKFKDHKLCVLFIRYFKSRGCQDKASIIQSCLYWNETVMGMWSPGIDSETKPLQQQLCPEGWPQNRNIIYIHSKERRHPIFIQRI